MEIIGFLLILGLVLHALHLRSRLEELSERLAALEHSRAPLPAASAPVANEPGVEPGVAPFAEAPLVVHLPVEHPPAEHPPAEHPPVELPAAERRAVPPPLPTVEVPAIQVAPTPSGPSLADRLRAWTGGEEWEALIGGSILNKLGALVLVIGIALFLGFSFGRISPAGRAAMACAVSLGILGGGVWAERQARYRFFARGLIGAGWAALYATAYAIYAIPAARVIGDPLAGSLILLAVAAGMIGHSLRYRAQAVTGVAYFSAFAALAVTPSSPFAVVSLIPLAASILYLAAKFAWYPMALFGMVATWATCVSRGGSDAPLAEVQALFITYWLLFGLFDLLRVKRRIVTGGIEWLYYGNLAGFAGLSYLAWSQHAPAHRWLAAATGSALFLADAIVRATLRPPSSFEATAGIGERLEAGSFEVSALVSALLGGASLVANVAGVWLSLGLALQAEAIYLIGARFASPFLQYLGIAAFAHSLLQVGLTPAGRAWTPPALFHAVLFYVNRAVRRPNVLMSSAAAALVALAIGIEVPLAHLGAGWIALAMVLFEAGLRLRAIEFRVQAYALALAGAATSMVAGDVPGLAVGLALVLACAIRSRWLDIEEGEDFALAAGGISMALAFVLLWRAVPLDYVALAWFGLVLVALELGNAKLPPQMRLYAAPAGAIALAGIVVTHSADFAKYPAQAVWLSYFGAAAVTAVAAFRIGQGVLRQGFVAGAAALLMAGAVLVTPDIYVTTAWTAIGLAVLELGFQEIAAGAFALLYIRLLGFDLWHTPLVAMPLAIVGTYWLWHRVRNRVVFWLAPIPLVALLLQTCGEVNAPPALMVLSLILLAAGIRFAMRDARLQSYIVAVGAFLLAAANLAVDHDVWTTCATVALLYGAQALAKRSEEARASAGLSIGASVLLAGLLFTKITGGMLTVGWGFEGLALLAAGFGLRERVLRLQGLATLLVCILKLFLYDLRNLDTLPRILSFIALGAIMLGVSWIYTRFRNQLKSLL